MKKGKTKARKTKFRAKKLEQAYDFRERAVAGKLTAAEKRTEHTRCRWYR